ncbi:MAG TPA: SpoIIE family protein phosphatase [Prolixibacteraceae bacterium]|nr:SpoIIE family protein phosphatase [Prolixibacteraceae bacterium]
MTSSRPDYHVEIDVQQKKPKGQVACGDAFKSVIIKQEGRKVIVLSDGIGHGIKASVLATLTVSMAINYSAFHTKPEIAARIIMRALPKSSDGMENYATFTLIEIDAESRVRIINYDNPRTIILRGNNILDPAEYHVEIQGVENAGKILRIREFMARKEDRIIFLSDGVTQSGLGSSRFPMGWGRDKVEKFTINQVTRMPDISATKLARKIINQANLNDGFDLKDDTTCGVIYFRKPREFLLITGPPFYKIKDYDVGEQIRNFGGKKAICGGTTAEIIARELDLKLETEHEFNGSLLPPKARLEGFELVTEGILTMGKVEEILENYSSDTRMGDTAADEIVNLLLEHDIIHIIVGTRINWAHQDPDQPVELEIRKVVLKRIIKLLEEKFFKEVKADFV